MSLRKNVSFKMKIDPHIRQDICTDQQRLKQILINLLRNSQKFTFEGYIKLSAKSVVMPAEEGSEVMRDYLVIKIKDTGVGIKNEDKKKLFQLFGKLNDPE